MPDPLETTDPHPGEVDRKWAQKREKHAVKVKHCQSVAGEGLDKPSQRTLVFEFQFCHRVTLGKSHGSLPIQDVGSNSIHTIHVCWEG